MNHQTFATWLLFLTLTSWQGFSYASPPPEELCDRLYADSLEKAKKALLKDKREDALRFLLDAASIIEQCINVPEENRQKQGQGSTFASNFLEARRAT